MVALLAGVLGLASADAAMVGATAASLERTFGIGTIEVGLLATITSAVSAVATVPAGMLVDSGRNRAHVLAIGMGLWSIAVAFGGAATTYPMLIASRVALGATTSISGPAVSSMSGSFFEVSGRGRAYSVLLSGELVGAGIGLMGGGIVSELTSWRGAWFLLAVAGLVLAVAVWRVLPDPGPAERDREHDKEHDKEQRTDSEEAVPDLPPPHPSRVLHDDPGQRPIWWAVRYVLSIRTNVVLIVASSLGYFFFAALRTFSVLLLRARYRLDTYQIVGAVAVIGVVALAGIVTGGRLGDRLMRRRRLLNARLVIAGVGFVTTALLFSAGLLTDSILIALPLFALGLAGLGSANPPLDAARLDVVPSGLRGRAEGVRTVCRSAAEAAAPLAFGLLAAEFGAKSLSKSSPSTATTGSALASTFIASEALLLVAGVVVLLVGRRSYPRDLSTAVASEVNLGSRKPRRRRRWGRNGA